MDIYKVSTNSSQVQYFSECLKCFRMLSLLIELDLKETSGAHLTQIPSAGLSPASLLLCPGGNRKRWKPASDPVSSRVYRQKGCPLCMLQPGQADSLQIARSPSQCWCFVVHKLHGQQALQDSNAYLLAGVVNPAELCYCGPSSCERARTAFHYALRIFMGHTVVIFHPFPDYNHLWNKIAS